jgi:hypothetical protein
MRGRTGQLLLAAMFGAALMSFAGAAPIGARSYAAPVNTTEPKISGTYVEGETLTATVGSWTGADSYTGQWVRCPDSGGKFDGSDCGNINGANGPYYELTKDDVGKRLRVRVTAHNADGETTVASNATPIIEAKKLDAPKNTKAPTISGSALVGSTLTVSNGEWTGSSPITYSYIWARCDASGGSCAVISGATANQYKVADADVGKTIRAQVTAKNDAGSANAATEATAVVASPAPPAPPGLIQLPSGEKSIPVTSVTNGERLVVAQVAFSPNPVPSRDNPITARIRIKDTRGYVVRGAIVFIRSTPRLTTGGDQQATGTDGWVTYQLTPFKNFPLKKGQNVQFFVKAYRIGDPVLAGVSNRRLVQVATIG